MLVLSCKGTAFAAIACAVATASAAEAAATAAVEEARKEGLSEAAAQNRGANIIGKILDAQNAEVSNVLCLHC